MVDECHRATGKADVVLAVKRMREAGVKFRVLGLSATPGRDRESVQVTVILADHHVCRHGPLLGRGMTRQTSSGSGPCHSRPCAAVAHRIRSAACNDGRFSQCPHDRLQHAVESCVHLALQHLRQLQP